jgi:hypothetical protein
MAYVASIAANNASGFAMRSNIFIRYMIRV